ncbi:uncharacterized protein LOC131649534 [Vicia villosa]|uniref:uncharacterized protein LOC131649534 n=1 Tax=Vicia villosa TaxID=3911 RepID=UPI00273AC584|nr:uncharacterized protein LOC131649534 [Vicia villosa]
MHGVTSVETNINWNGNKNEFFRPQRGIRQGDPMSPYLFVLCMDKLSHLIEHAINEKHWKSFQLGRNGVSILHLMFADDLLIFGEANKAQLNCVKATLETFCSMSGQEISAEKSSILFSDNVPRRIRNQLTHISGFRETQSFDKYLGIPLKGKANRKQDFQYVVDQVANKLSGWKARNLSFAGRVTLAKSVIEAIPTYPMMTNLIPKASIYEIQKIQRSLSSQLMKKNGTTEELKKIVGSLNKAKVLGKDITVIYSFGSRTVIALHDGSVIFDSVQLDISELVDGIPRGCRLTIVSDSCYSGGFHRTESNWALSNTGHFFDSGLVDCYTAFEVHQFANGNRKKATWFQSNTRKQNNSNDYGYHVMKIMLDIVSANITESWMQVFDDPTELTQDDLYDLRLRWTKCFIELYKLYLWQNRISLSGFGLDGCSLCGAAQETSLHVLRDCWHDWIELNILSDIHGSNDWGDIWATACHTIWQWRNKEKHDTTFKRPFCATTVIMEKFLQYKKAMVNKNMIMERYHTVKLVHWCTPKHGFVKLNIDGAHDHNGLSGSGGIIRDSHGTWIGGFSNCIGSCSPLMAELWSVYLGIKLVLDLGYLKVEVESDAIRAVDCIKMQERNKNKLVESLVSNIVRSLSLFEEVEIKYVYREANNCANLLAREGKKLRGDTIYYSHPPPWLLTSLEEDRSFLASPKIISL